MRHLRAYILTRHYLEFEKEARKNLAEYAKLREKGYDEKDGDEGLTDMIRLVESSRDLVRKWDNSKLLASAEERIGCWENGTFTYFYFMFKDFYKQGKRENSLGYFFDELEFYLLRDCTMAGIMLRSFDKHYTFSTNKITIRLGGKFSNITHLLLSLTYMTPYGKAFLDKSNTLHVGKNTFSLEHSADNVISINNCRLYYYRHMRFTFGYHICTNTFYYDEHNCRHTDRNCSRAHMIDLWCIRVQLVRKMNQVAGETGVVSKPGEVICNFL